MRASLEPSTNPGDYPFSHPIRARFAETDAMGIIHHGAYAAYLEETRVAMLRAAGLPYGEVRDHGIDLVVLELVVRYRRPLGFDEVVDVHARVGDVARATFQIGYLLVSGDAVRSTAVTVHGAVDHSGRAARLPPPLRELLTSAATSARRDDHRRSG